MATTNNGVTGRAHLLVFHYGFPRNFLHTIHSNAGTNAFEGLFTVLLAQKQELPRISNNDI